MYCIFLNLRQSPSPQFFIQSGRGEGSTCGSDSEPGSGLGGSEAVQSWGWLVQVAVEAEMLQGKMRWAEGKDTA